MGLNEDATLEKDRAKAVHREWDDTIQHREPTVAWQGKVIERGLSYKLNDKFCTIWEPSTPDFEKQQIHLAGMGAKNVDLTYRVKFDPGYPCPASQKIVHMMSGRILGWPTKFKTGDQVTVYNWRNEQGYVQWGIKA